MGTEERTVRDSFHALLALMKEHPIAAVYNHENPEMLGMSSMMGDGWTPATCRETANRTRKSHGWRR